ncbi:hypothetical protein [Pseudomonas monteilii]|uniref:DUF7415 domain-containing protein n=1 Tax=Pseudomonas monteilii TaxID=76759 RepID=UPI001E3157D8|nr:hypothetical protein [Pseudomonas monteilii]MCE0875974.1 hypothetical protein [Pseudomonas monteilii]MCE0930653.1 hypothetical protein [Pseudomonas monteilii]MCE0977335.1 hypothetical protein [Pseudomonas monteilii]MCE1010830.1 hypothetical protein [Pseudomonas monteilii]MCE1039553.1 hypothetical protein [Pseudomonas monteilii]
MASPIIDWNELSRRGLLVRINREILHPLGLAVCRDPETGLSPGAVVSDAGPFVYPEDEGSDPHEPKEDE